MVSPWELVLSSCVIFLLFYAFEKKNYDVDLLLPLCLVNETSYLAGHFVYIKT